MSKPITVLATGIGSCGPGEGVVKALKHANTQLGRQKYRIIGCDMNALSAMTFRVDGGYQVPRCTDPAYFDRINEICKKEKVDILIPGSDAECDAVSNNIDKIDTAVYVMVHPKETVNICRDAWNTHQWLAENGFPTPQSYLPGQDASGLGWPRIIKDRFGGGSKNVFIVENEDELKDRLEHFKRKKLQPIIQEYVGSMDEEYTTGVMVDKDGEILSSVTFRRTLIAGASGVMTCDEYPEVTATAEKIAKALQLHGSINVQSRLVDGTTYAFEMNPRFSGSEPIRVGVGVNEVDRAIDYYYLGKKLERVYPKKAAAMRCFQEVIGTLEDLEKLKKGEGLDKAGKINDYI